MLENYDFRTNQLLTRSVTEDLSAGPNQTNKTVSISNQFLSVICVLSRSQGSTPITEHIRQSKQLLRGLPTQQIEDMASLTISD